VRLGGELHIHQTHGMACGLTIDPHRGPVRVPEGQFLVVAAGAGNGAVHRQLLVVKQDPAQGGPGVADGSGGGVVAADVAGHRLVRVVVQVVRIDGPLEDGGQGGVEGQLRVLVAWLNRVITGTGGHDKHRSQQDGE
jgi:hypothetical protein